MKMDINRRVKELRSLIGVSQNEFAEVLGVPQNRIARIELNRNPPSTELLKSICFAYGVNLSWLINGEEPIFKSGSNIYNTYQKANLPTQGNLLTIILSEIEKLSPNMDIKLKANVVAFYYEYYIGSTETEYETIKNEIINTFKVVTYFLGGRK
ncbi:MAG: helix-turn-helix domain-containing protein [Deferribacteraceae bacterium]|jgi:transcriptional regulator with XRE-family HTH domain|nr:helix-turn-helix domain-containing protein [Deferribacteraceae bacterium]